jgi:hypothetical protein
MEYLECGFWCNFAGVDEAGSIMCCCMDTSEVPAQCYLNKPDCLAQPLPIDSKQATAPSTES